MKIKLLIKSVFILFITTSSFSQETQLSYLLIPQELKENANAVIRLNEKTVIVESIRELIVKEKRIITVLNKLGDNYVDAYVHYNDDTKVKKLSAVIYNAFGKKIIRYSKNKFKDVSAVDGGTLYSDSRAKYLDYTPTSYPYTIVFESEYENSSTGFIPNWFPVEGYYVSVEKSVFNFINNAQISYRKLEKNFTDYKISKEIKSNGLLYELENQKVVDYERHTLHSREFLPKLNISLDQFSLKGINGEAANWKIFGKWMYDYLIKGRDVLDNATLVKVKELVKGIDDPIEKAKKVYAFMQNNTRYISVQVGIGGWEPIAANKVDAVGYGDCKGLTNYTKALLDVVGVKSYHTLVYADNKRNIDKEFASFQGNHMILNIPNKGNDIWLECTSQTKPFGFLGDFTDDRNVLVITPEGGIIKRTPKYINQDNLQTINADVNLLENGSLTASLVRKSYGIQYNDKYYLADDSKSDLEKYYKSTVWDYNNNLEVQKTNIVNNKENIEFIENIDLTIKDYARVKDSSFLFRVNVLNKYSSIPKRYRKRERPLKISRGFYDKDEVVIKLPKDYHTTFLPQPKEIKTKFGYYKVVIEKVSENSIKYTRELLLKEGVFPKEDYKKYRSFRKKIAKYDNLRLELTKQ